MTRVSYNITAFQFGWKSHREPIRFIIETSHSALVVFIAGCRMSERGQGVHYGDERRSCLREAKIDPRTAHVSFDERNFITYGSHQRGMYLYNPTHFALDGRLFKHSGGSVTDIDSLGRFFVGDFYCPPELFYNSSARIFPGKNWIAPLQPTI